MWALRVYQRELGAAEIAQLQSNGPMLHSPSSTIVSTAGSTTPIVSILNMRERGSVHLERSAILAIAPPDLTSYRSLRYRGDDQTIPLAAFTAAEQATISVLYAFLRGLEASVETIDAFLRNHDLDELVERITAIGAMHSPATAATAHDLRGGVFSVLLLELSASPADRLPVHRVRSLVRDCSKQLRNLLADIDPPARARDLEVQFHSIPDLVSTLRDFQGSMSSGPVTLTVSADSSASIAASCAELGTIERIAFNLLENAARHARTHEVEASLVTMGKNVRIAITNTLSDEDAGRISSLLGGDPAVLYSSFSSTGSGYGLRIAAELVARAYGIDTVPELVAGGYIGTSVINGIFVSWFHWPLAPSDGTSCDCREESRDLVG